MKTKTHPLRIAMEARNLTLELAAEDAKVGVTTIKRVLRGEHIGPDSRRLLCQYFGKTSQELGLLTDVSSQSELVLPLDYEELFWLLSAAPGAGGIDMNLRAHMSRRAALEYLRALGITVVTATIASSSILEDQEADAQARIDQAVKKNRAPDEVAVTHLEKQMDEFWNLVPDRVGLSSVALLSCVDGQIQTLTKLLKPSQDEDHKRRLWVLIGELTQIAGLMSFDMEKHDLAKTYYAASIKAAQSAGHDALTATAFGRMSFIPTYQGHPDQSVLFQQEAYRLASGSATATTRAWLYAIGAEAQAHLGVKDGCKSVLLQSADALSGQHQYLDDPYRTGFDLVKLHGYEGACFVRLQLPNDALTSLQAALVQLDSSRVRYHAILRTDMAQALSQQGDLTEASNQAGQAIDLVLRIGSANVSKRLQTFRASLPANYKASDLEERLKLLA